LPQNGLILVYQRNSHNKAVTEIIITNETTLIIRCSFDVYSSKLAKHNIMAIPTEHNHPKNATTA
jgi:hypothetical protein